MAGNSRNVHQFLVNIFYTNSPSPRLVTRGEIEQVKILVESFELHEKKVFTEFLSFKNGTPDHNLWVLAVRDTDGDGIKDYVIDEYSGKFREGDLDIDGDGILNVYDKSPYDKSLEQIDLKNIPGHLDWKLQGKSRELISIQSELYVNYRVILVERGYNFTEAIAQGFLDLVKTLFKDQFIKGAVNPALRIVAMEENVYFRAQSDLSGATLGMYMGFNPTLIVFSETASLNKTYMLGVLAHELSHSYQYRVDYSVENINRYLIAKDYDISHFHNLISLFGFTARVKDSFFDQFFEFISPTYTEPTRFSYILDKQSMNEWRTKINVFGMNSDAIREGHVVSPYSLSGPWEWLSEQTTAYLFNEMEKYAKRSLSSNHYNRIKKSLIRNSNLDSDIRTFYHQNVSGGKTEAFLKDHFPMNDLDLEYLIRKYGY